MAQYKVAYIVEEEGDMLVEIDPALDPKEREEFAREEISEAMFVHEDNLTILSVKEV